MDHCPKGFVDKQNKGPVYRKLNIDYNLFIYFSIDLSAVGFLLLIHLHVAYDASVMFSENES